MKRRRVIQSLLGLPALTALPAFPQSATDQSKPQPREKLPPELKPAPVEEFPKLETTNPAAVGTGQTKFFSELEFTTLRRLCGLIVPSAAGGPGAQDAAVPEFLDFLIGQSPAPRQQLYRTGLDRIEKEARKRNLQGFAELAEADASALLQPLREPLPQPGTPDKESGVFLHAIKDDVLRATINSREWAAASTQRRGFGTGTYWRTIE